MTMTSPLLPAAPTGSSPSLPAVDRPSVIPVPRVAPDTEAVSADVPSDLLSDVVDVLDGVPEDVIGELRHISHCYRVCRAKADSLRTRPSSGDAADRNTRDDLMRALQQLHVLRERRSSLLETYDLPSTAGSM